MLRMAVILLIIFNPDYLSASNLHEALNAYSNNNFSVAAKLLPEWANNGNSEAQYSLARMYDNGWGVRKDTDKAQSLYLKAANNGHSLANKLLVRDKGSYVGKLSYYDQNAFKASVNEDQPSISYSQIAKQDKKENNNQIEALIDSLEKRFPELNPNSNIFDQELIDRIIKYKNELLYKGFNEVNALKEAAEYYVQEYREKVNIIKSQDHYINPSDHENTRISNRNNSYFSEIKQETPKSNYAYVIYALLSIFIVYIVYRIVLYNLYVAFNNSIYWDKLKQASEFYWIFILCMVLSILGLFQMPQNYYVFMRTVFFFSFIYIIYCAYKRGATKYIIVGILAILYNPFLPVYLYNKPLWIAINIFSVYVLYRIYIVFKINDNIVEYEENH